VTLPPPAELKVSSIQIPAGGTEMRGDTTFFAVDVYPEGGGAPWRTMRRYNDFHSLNASIGTQLPGAAFPRKHLMGCTGSKLESRRAGLELWLQRVLENPSSRTAWTKRLVDFLEAGRVMMQTSPAAMSSPAAPGSQRLQLAAPKSSAPQSAVPAASDVQLIQIEVPHGCRPGQHLGVTVPDGRQLTVVVPEGVAAGAVLDLEFTASTGTLAYLPAELPEVASNQLILEVQVPPGVTPGQLMSVPCPDGQNVTVTVPPNSVPGGVLTLSYDQAKRTLTPVTS